MRITVLCPSDDVTWELMQLTAQNRTEYCMKHRYQLVLPKYLSFKHFVMEKEIQIQNQLKYCDWLLFMGVDTCFTNMNTTIESLIDKYEFTAQNGIKQQNCLIIGKDVNGINNDVMLIKSCMESEQFLGATIGLHNQFDNDQHAMHHLIKQDSSHIAVIHQKEINAMPYWMYSYPDHKGGQWEPGDFILHAPGMPLEKRIIVIKGALEKVVR